MTTTDEDLQTKQKNVADLRQKVTDANAERETIEKGLANDVVAQALDAEAATLEKQLEDAKYLVKLAAGEVEVVPPDVVPPEVVPPEVTVAVADGAVAEKRVF